MHCHVCNVAVGDGQQFCHECGESLSGVTDPTQPIDKIDDATLERADTAAALPSETVEPPQIAEPMSATAAHAGALPDLAAPTPTPPSDDEWMARLGAPDPATMPQPPTQPIEQVDSELAVEPAMSELETDLASDSTPATGVTPVIDANTPPPIDLDPSVDEVWAPAAPYDTDLNDLVDATPAAGGITLPEPTPTMAMPEPIAAGVATDEFAEVGTDTTQIPAVFDGGPDVAAHAVPQALTEPEGFRLRASFVFGLLAVVTVLMASVADLIDIRTSRPVDGIPVGFTMLDDIGTNLAIAGFIATAVMLVGGLLSCFGLRWGAGLSGGAGVSLIGWAAMVLGRVENPIYAAQQVTRSATSDVSPFTLSITRDLGWFLIVAAAALGLLVFLSSLRMAGTGNRRGLNPWIAALGALTMVIAAAGPLIPLGGNAFDVNLAVDGFPQAFFAGRIVQVALLVVTGVVGFLSVRNYGLGFAAGGIAALVWLWITSLIELGDLPVGIAIGNIGTSTTTPHSVTSVGMGAAIAMIVIAAAMSFAGRNRA